MTAESGVSTSGAARIVRGIESDAAATWAMRACWPIGVVIIAVLGRHQWFVRDDWAFVFTRQRMHEVGGLDSMLMAPQDGHWMLWPILVFRLLYRVFGVGSYLPYLIVLWVTHVGIVVLARRWMIRLGVSPITTTLMSAVLLLFGAGWENLFFAVQIVYNFSLLAFLAHTLLVDHDGPIDRRDWAGSAISLFGVSSSGFGPFFGFGVGLLLVLRRRWEAAALAVIPQAVLWAWWWATWGDDPAGDTGTAGVRFVGRFTEFGVRSTFGSLVGTPILGIAALVLTVGIALWKHTGGVRRAHVIAMLATTLVMFVGIALRREAFGVAAAAQSRYQYVGAVLVAPSLALGLDQARRFAGWAPWVVRLLLVFALARNVIWMNDRGDVWADLAADDRRLFSLVAGSPQRLEAPPDRSMTSSSPDVRVSDLATLVEDGAITPDPPDTDAERDQVLVALGLGA